MFGITVEAASVDCAYVDGAYVDIAQLPVDIVAIDCLEEWPLNGRLGRLTVGFLSGA